MEPEAVEQGSQKRNKDLLYTAMAIQMSQERCDDEVQAFQTNTLRRNATQVRASHNVL